MLHRVAAEDWQEFQAAFLVSNSDYYVWPSSDKQWLMFIQDVYPQNEGPGIIVFGVEQLHQAHQWGSWPEAEEEYELQKDNCEKWHWSNARAGVLVMRGKMAGQDYVFCHTVGLNRMLKHWLPPDATGSWSSIVLEYTGDPTDLDKFPWDQTYVNGTQSRSVRAMKKWRLGAGPQCIQKLWTDPDGLSSGDEVDEEGAMMTDLLNIHG